MGRDRAKRDAAGEQWLMKGPVPSSAMRVLTAPFGRSTWMIVTAGSRQLQTVLGPIQISYGEPNSVEV